MLVSFRYRQIDHARICRRLTVITVVSLYTYKYLLQEVYTSGWLPSGRDIIIQDSEHGLAGGRRDQVRADVAANERGAGAAQG